MNNLVNKNISLESCSFYIIDQNRTAIAEISIIPKELAISYLSESQTNSIDTEKIKHVIDATENIYFFNRLNVPKTMQKNGYGKMLLDSLKEHLDNTNSFLINTANAYGDMSQKDLISFYQDSGMRLINEDGLLIYHKNIEPISLNQKKKKIKV